jgi:transglutaminase-like putative cysteine protease
MPNSGSADGVSVTYDVDHTTRYEYSESVSVSHHTVRLSPRRLPHQDCMHHELEVTPAPAVTRTHVDYFGNAMTFFVMEGAHSDLTVRSRSRVVISPRSLPAPASMPPWEGARDHDQLPLDAIECLFDSSSIQASEDLAVYARPSFASGRPVLEAVAELTRRIHDDFRFDPGATTVATPLSDVFRLRRGVCQDFARLEIACLRSLGLAARYVSGYLETVPPPGATRLAGADASHAWLAVFCPGSGWIDVDPTTNLLPSTTHVTLAWGRDYDDVSPIRGVMLGGGTHSLRVSVDVTRVDGTQLPGKPFADHDTPRL